MDYRRHFRTDINVTPTDNVGADWIDHTFSSTHHANACPTRIVVVIFAPTHDVAYFMRITSGLIIEMM